MKKIVFCLLLAAISIMANTLPALGLQDISIQAESTENRFPSEIVFRLEARSSADIKKITFIYNLGRSSSSAYGYPEFAPGREVKAVFSLKTQGAKYIPPGARIRYHYLIEDEAGHQLRTEERALIYEDTRFRWEKLSRDLITVYYHDDARSAAERILDVALSTVERMGSQAGVRLADPVKILVYNSKQEIDVALPFVSETTRRELITLGEAHPDFDLVLMMGSGARSQVEETAAHELTHIIVHQATDNPFSELPVWLNEGLAVYAEGDLGTINPYVRALDQAIKENRVPPLRWLSARPGKPDEVILFYGQSYSVTRYMIEKYGPDKMRDLLAALKSGDNLDLALKKVYGISIDELDAQWRKSVGLAPAPTAQTAPPAPPRSVPTLVPFGAKPPAPQAQPTSPPGAETNLSPPPTISTSPETSSLVFVSLGATAVVFVLVVGGLFWWKHR